MSGDPSRDFNALPLTIAHQLDKICDQFEADLQAGGHPTIEAYLACATEPHRSALFRALLALEIELLGIGRAGSVAQQYAQRFPAYNSVVAAVFGEAGSPISAGNRFRILSPHARGGLGEVFLARDLELNREVALKRIKELRADDPGCRARFMLEAEVTGRLEHPGVVPVYSLGNTDDGRPYYAMRLIRGHSLKEAISHLHGRDGRSAGGPGERSLALRRLLDRFVDVCNAIAYAHSRGIIHRDLKPSNIMLGPYGETLVVDWGLAKPIGQTGDAPSVPEGLLEMVSPSGSISTQMGRALGTPGYMSPEQAAGQLDTLGPATDVYGLGATLYSLLTGQSPFVNDGIDEVLRKVRQGNFPAPREVNPRVPRALGAISQKAMALRPEDRYTTARALAEDIEKWLADEPTSASREPLHHRAIRWCRRHRPVLAGMAAILITGIIALALSNVMLSQEQQRTEDQRLQAVKNFADAQRQHGEANRQRDRADENFQQARNAVKDYLTTVSESTLLNQQGLQPLRKQLLEHALKYYQDFLKQRGNDPSLRLELADAYANVARIHDVIGSKADALAAYKSEAAIEESYREDGPAKDSIKKNLANCYINIGTLQQETGHPAEALQTYAKASDLYEELKIARPDDVNLLNDLASRYNNIGHLQRASGQVADALRSFQQASRVLEKVSAKLPSSTEFQSHLANSYNNIALLQLASGRPSEALHFHQQARAIRERLAASAPPNPSYRYVLAQSLNNIGMVYEQTGRPNEALGYYRQCRDIFERLAAVEPAATDYQFYLAASEFNIGLLLRAIGHPVDALRSTEKAQGIMTKLLKANPNVTRYQGFWGDCTFNLGVLQQEAGHSSEALLTYQQALQNREATASANPGIVAHQKNLADTFHGLGELQRDTGHEPEASRSFQRALMIREALAAKHPSVPVHQNDLAESLIDIGKVERRLGNVQQALGLHLRARDIFARLVALNPENLEYRSSLGASYDQTGMDLATLNRQNEAESAYRHALENQHAAYKKAPEVTRYRRLLSETLQHSATLLRSMNRRLEATSLILERRKLWPGNPGELYNAALELAACIPPTDPGQLEPSPAALAERRKFSDWVMDTIQEALDAGFNDVGRLQSDGELDPLRSRTDFKAFISDLVFPSNPFAR